MTHPKDDKSADDADQGGAVSEVDNLGGGELIQPEQSVAAAPDDDDVQEGRQGPNARTGDEKHA